MKSKTRKRKIPGFMRQVLALNITNLLEHHYKESRNRTMALAKDAGISLSSVQRTLGRETGASVDTIEAIAAVFHLSAYQLLLPLLEVRNPQVVKGATKDEERLYRQWKSLKPADISHR